MIDFKGFKDWIEIFRGGEQTDSQGRKHNGDGLIDKALSSFNAADHTPPIVIGHPKENAPAFGWIQGLRKSTKNGVVVLEAKIDQIVPEFEAAVSQGLYKKRSASFYPDGRLRHVGFLGAAPPAVKGLADLAFKADDKSIVFEFGEQPGNDPTTTAGQYIDKNHKTGGAQMSETTGFLNDLKAFFGFAREAGWQPPSTGGQNTGDTVTKSFTEADLAKAKEEAEAVAREKLVAEFADKEKALKDKELAAEQAATKAMDDARKLKINTIIDTKVKDGIIPPAFVEMGLKEFLQTIDGAGEFSFAEGGQDKKLKPVDFFMSIMDKAGEINLFSELATRERLSPDFAEQERENKLGDAIAAKVRDNYYSSGGDQIKK